MKEFSITDIDLTTLNISRRELRSLDQDFFQWVPLGEILWIINSSAKAAKVQRALRISGEDRSSPGNRTGKNGQIQLWQFLLELLTDKGCSRFYFLVQQNGEQKTLAKMQLHGIAQPVTAVALATASLQTEKDN
ncbi:GA-binding protein alpha chain [Plecturocebus cupreus]